MEAAKEWGIVPWELSKGNSAIWFMRWIEWKNVIAKLEEKSRK